MIENQTRKTRQAQMDINKQHSVHGFSHSTQRNKWQLRLTMEMAKLDAIIIFIIFLIYLKTSVSNVNKILNI